MKVVELSNVKARRYFMDPQCYGSMELPPYFDFGTVLSEAEKSLAHYHFSNDLMKRAKNCEGVNYTLVDNKDGKYAWRPLQLIHPYLYAELVHTITTKRNWAMLVGRFAEYAKLEKIRCASIPVVKQKKDRLKAEQISEWWTGFEQESVAQALKYKVMFVTDVADCYGSIYTHSIAWALHGKEVAKVERDNGMLLGNVIDWRIQAMRYGQTNGISQGSTVMDFVAEIVLGYADELLAQALKSDGVEEYFILRYRDDYRVFVNDTAVGEKVLKDLTMVLAGLGMRINSAKTRMSTDVVLGSIKPDKLAWLAIDSNFRTLSFEKKLLLLYDHATRFPNCGSILVPLTELHNKFDEEYVTPAQSSACTAILIELAYRNPRCYQLCMGLIAKLILTLTDDARQRIANDILGKFLCLPNTGYLQLWLQRIMLPCKISLKYTERMCNIVDDPFVCVWNHEWLKEDKDLWRAMVREDIINKRSLEEIGPTMSEKEVSLFISRYSEGYQG